MLHSQRVRKNGVGLLGGLLLLVMLWTLLAPCLPARAEEAQDGESAPERTVAFPDDLRAVTLRPQTDYDPAADPAQLQQPLSEKLGKLASVGFNTVIVETSNEDGNYYSVDNASFHQDDALSAVVDAAREAGLYVYLGFDVNRCGDPLSQDYVSELMLSVHKLTLKYRPDAVLISNYYSQRSQEMYLRYLKFGSGIGYENWLRDFNAYLMQSVTDAVKQTSNTIGVGLLTDPVWASVSSNPAGADISTPSFEVLAEGFSDVKAYLEQGLVDFAVVDNPSSLSDTDVPFETVAKWWSDLGVAAQVPVFLSLSNEKLCTDAAGWNSPDHIVRQLVTAKKYPGIKGCVLRSAQQVLEDTQGSTTALTRYYANELDESGLFEELKIDSPAKTTFVTYDPTVKFAGSFDPNFDVYLDGEKIQLNQVGNFYIEKELKTGLNTFQITHKGNTVTYRITRKIKVLQSVTPSEALTVDGGTQVAIRAVAYQGATVTASIAGTTISLKQVQTSDQLDPTSFYAEYTGTFVAPSGSTSGDKPLGNIVVTAVYGSFQESMTAGSITVIKLPQTIDPVLPPSSGELPYDPDGPKVTYVELNSNDTYVFNAKNTDTYPTPDYTFLPKGTRDFYVRTSGSYYITQSGKRVKKSDASLVEFPSYTGNRFSNATVSQSGGFTTLKMDSLWKAPFRVVYEPLSFTGSGDYNFTVNDFSPDKVSIIFDYLYQDCPLPSFDGTIFSSARWVKTTEDGMDKMKLELTLRQKGIFAGFNASYDANGALVLQFREYPRTLSGLNVVVDPGHGYADSGALGYVVERDVNLAIAKKLETALKNAGANVYRIPTETRKYELDERVTVAKSKNADIFISVHSNSAASSAQGVEAYYFNPFTKPLTDAIVKRIASQVGVVQRPTKYFNFAVTRVQSHIATLVEYGFVTNKTEAENFLGNPQKQELYAAATVNGIKDFLARAK